MKINLRPVWGWMYRFMPVEKNTAFFSSFYGQYNDNPRYVSEELHRKMPDMKIIWVRSKKNHDGFPDYVNTVEYLSKDYYKYVSCAQVVVDNHTGMRDYKVLADKNWLKKVWYRLYTQKRKQQFCISTWHGTPLKTIGEDASRIEHYSCADYLTVGCQMTLELFDKAFNGVFPQRLYGSPRNDVLLKQQNVNDIKKKLGIPLNSKVVLFAPTFRTDANSEYSGSKQIQMFNLERLFNELNEHVAEGEWVFVYRCHHVRMGGSKVQGDMMIDGNQHDDMAEYLCCADVLITDYSSSMFDFAITKKPCFLFVPDIEYYRDVERGFMIPFESLPFPWGETFESFLEAIRTFNRDKYEQTVTEYLKRIGNHEDGRASERVVKDIAEFVRYGRKMNY